MSDGAGFTRAARDAAVAAAARVYGLDEARAVAAPPSLRSAVKRAQVAAALALSDFAGMAAEDAGGLVGVSRSAVNEMRRENQALDNRAAAAAVVAWALAGTPRAQTAPIPGNRTRRSKVHEGAALAAFPDPTARGDCAGHLKRIERVLGKGVGFPVLPFVEAGPRVAGPWARP